MILLLLAALAAHPHASASSAAHCPWPTITLVQNDKRGSGFRRLDELPPASHYLAVDRHIAGCLAPAVVRTGIGR